MAKDHFSQEREINFADVEELNEDEQMAEARRELDLGTFEAEMNGATIEEIKNSGIQAVAILSGSTALRRIFKHLDNIEHKEVPTSFQETDENNAVTGAHARYSAAVALTKLLESDQLFFISTSGRKSSDDRTHAQIGKEYLLGLSSRGFKEGEEKTAKIPEEKIILEEHSKKTLYNLIEVIGIAWQKGLDKIGILSNLYHLPRSKEFSRCLKDPDLLNQFLKNEKTNIDQTIARIVQDTNAVLDQELTSKDFFAFAKKLQVIFIGAEDMLIEYEKTKKNKRKGERTYQSVLKEVEYSDGYQKRLKIEAEGYNAFLRKKYKTKAT